MKKQIPNYKPSSDPQDANAETHYAEAIKIIRAGYDPKEDAAEVDTVKWAERVIALSPVVAIRYASEVLKSRFERAERRIVEDGYYPEYKKALDGVGVSIPNPLEVGPLFQGNARFLLNGSADVEIINVPTKQCAFNAFHIVGVSEYEYGDGESSMFFADENVSSDNDITFGLYAVKRSDTGNVYHLGDFATYEGAARVLKDLVGLEAPQRESIQNKKTTPLPKPLPAKSTTSARLKV